MAALSLILLGAAAILLLQVVQLNARARGYAVTPAQVQEWYPDLEHRPGRRRVVNLELRHHAACWGDLVRRARIRYNIAIVALLCGIAVLLVPEDGAKLTAARWAAVSVIVFGAFAEVAAMLAGWARRNPGNEAAR